MGGSGDLGMKRRVENWSFGWFAILGWYNIIYDTF